MAALLAEPYSAEGIKPGYVFSPDGVYRQPGRDVSTHADYLGYIRALPAAQSPQVFGLHENASITKDLKETRELFEATLSTQATATGGGAGGSSQDELLQRIAEDISAKLPAEYDVDAAQAQFPADRSSASNWTPKTTGRRESHGTHSQHFPGIRHERRCERDHRR